MNIFFDTKQLYFIPQYLPVYRELEKRGHKVTLAIYPSTHDNIIEDIAKKENLNIIWVKNNEESLNAYKEGKADWVFFGNRCKFLDELHSFAKSIQLGHGVGPKTSYYSKSSTNMTVRFVEGAYRCKRLYELFPEGNFFDVGFSKLDPIFNKEPLPFDIKSLGLDPNKKTIVYAPTFYPSSIEKFHKNWPEHFENFNILIKPHYFSISKKKLRKQKKLLEHWGSFPNTYLAKTEDYSLVPFLALGDILLSDASSAIIEFAALNKPTVLCKFLKVRLTYRGPFRYRFERRMDEDYKLYSEIAEPVEHYKELKEVVEQHLSEPGLKEQQRLQLTEKLVGTIDGQVSVRIANYLENYKK